MEETNVFLQQTHQSDSNPQSLFYSLDPISLVLSQNSSNPELRLTSESYFTLERGPRYGEYAQLRESKIRMKHYMESILEEERKEEKESFIREEKKTPVKKQVRFGGELVNSHSVGKLLEAEEEKEEERFLPAKKQVRFGGNIVNSRKGSSSSSLLAQSVPDFSAMVRKENRKPANANALPRAVELTPPPLKKSLAKNGGILMSTGSRGSKSASAGEKNKGFGLTRKSYASVEDLRKISTAAASAINGDRGGKRAGGNRTVLGYRQFY